MVNQQRKDHTMTQQTNNQPADTIRYRGLKGVIWKNPGKDDQPDRYSVSYNHTYKTAAGQWKETSSLSEVDNLKIGHLIPIVCDRITELKIADRNEAQVTEEGDE